MEPRPELSGGRSAADVVAERATSLVEPHRRDLLRVAYAITSDPQLASAAMASAAARAGRAGSLTPTLLRLRLLRSVSIEARRRVDPSFMRRLVARAVRRRRPPPAPPGIADHPMVDLLGGLGPEDRQVLALRYAAGLTDFELAGLMELTALGLRARIGELRERAVRALSIEAEPGGPPLGLHEVDARIAARLVAHLDRGMGSTEVGAAAPWRWRVPRLPLPHVGKRAAIAGGTAGLALVLLGVLLLGPFDGSESAQAQPTPSPGTMIALAGWSERQVAEVPGSYRVLDWAPDGEHVAVLEVDTSHVAVFDRAGHEVRRFAGKEAAWLDSAHLLTIVTPGPLGYDGGEESTTIERTIGSDADVLVTGPAVTGVVAGGGGVALRLASAQTSSEPSPPTFATVRNGQLGETRGGLPLAWSPDGRLLAYLADASARESGGYRGRLHVLDSATLADTDLGVTADGPWVASFAPGGRWLLVCTATTMGTPCLLTLVDLRTRSVQTSTLKGPGASAAWAADGSVLLAAGGTVARWLPGDEPVATRWQPPSAYPVKTLIAAGPLVVAGLARGPERASEVLGIGPRLLVLPGAGVFWASATRDGTQVAYARTATGSGDALVLATVPRAAGASAEPAASPIPSPAEARALAGVPIVAARTAYQAGPVRGNTGAVWGSHAYVQTYVAEDGRPTLELLDVTSQVSTHIELVLATNEAFSAVATDGSHLAAMITRPLGPVVGEEEPCPREMVQPIAWRIVVAPLDASGRPTSPFSVLASGTATRPTLPNVEGVECAVTSPPRLALSAGLVAYDLEAPSAANRWASAIVVRRLSNGAVVRTLATPAPVGTLGLADGELAWTESPDRSASGRWSLRRATAADALPRVVRLAAPLQAGAPPSITLADGALFITTWQPDDPNGSAVWSIASDGGGRRLSPPGKPCWLAAAADADALMWCTTPSLGQGHLLVWRDGALRALDVFGPLGAVAVGGGWAVVETYADDGIFLNAFALDDVPR